jgi:2-dehydro-3-deoxyphosphogluconate aldolase/(4S)-4-hydroxy-2-oxoglutarate aldolase
MTTADAIRLVLPDAIRSTGVIAVLRASSAAEYRDVAERLIAGGVVCLETTLTTPGTLEYLGRLIQEIPEACVGVGTVLSKADAADAISAGAQYLVTPTSDPEVITYATTAGVPVIAGAFSPSEVELCWRLGASAVKLFPAETLGPDYSAHLRGPFPDLITIPSGGIALDQISSWIGAGSAAVSLGGPLLGPLGADADPNNVTHRARRAIEAVRSARETLGII